MLPSGSAVLLQAGVGEMEIYLASRNAVVLTYEAGSKRRTDNLVKKLMIVRTPRLENKNGVAIEMGSFTSLV